MDGMGDMYDVVGKTLCSWLLLTSRVGVADLDAILAFLFLVWIPSFFIDIGRLTYNKLAKIK
jgi:hypothetical protein